MREYLWQQINQQILCCKDMNIGWDEHNSKCECYSSSFFVEGRTLGIGELSVGILVLDSGGESHYVILSILKILHLLEFLSEP